MKDKLNLTKTKIIFLILLLIIILSGTTYAILTWASSNTSIAGSTKCFKVDYTKGQDINFGSITSGTGLVAQTTFNKDEAVSTTLTISRNKDCDICGTGTISANISSSIDLSKGGLSYKVYKGNEELKTGSITKTGVNTLFEDFNISSESSQFTIYFYLDADKINNDYLKTNFTGKIYAEATSNKYLCNDTASPNVTTFLTAKYSSGTKIAVTTTGGEAINQVTTEGIMQDSYGNIRYYGANPNNYVTFNNETAGWRIIGVFDTEDADGNVSKRIKLIRATSIGIYAYDNKPSGVGTSKSNSGSNDWTDARLMMLLNPGYEKVSSLYAYEGSLYWNRKSGTCYAGSSEGTTSCDFTSTGLTDKAKSQIDKVKYYLGGNVENQGLYADDYYNFERGTKVYSGHQTTWVGYVGLMYPSDYAYATDLNVCTKDGYGYADDTINCSNKDWLLDTEHWNWTLSPCSSGNYGMSCINTSKYFLNDDGTFYAHGVRPVLYLKPSIKIVSGTGTQSDPYILQ